MKSVALAAIAAVAGATEAPQTNLALTWKDCGGAAKINSVTPSSIPLGASTTITGSGTSSIAVSGGNFAATVKAGWIPLASCSGPLGPAKTCTLPLGAGSLTLDPVPLPIAAGPAAISLKVALAASLPAQLASTTTHATATSSSGQGLVCLDIYLKNAEVVQAPQGNLALTWKDCGGAAKISSVTPSTIPLGKATTITGSGTTSVAVSGGNFAATVKAGWIPLASCSGPLGPAKTCTLPLGAGSLTLDPVPLPIAVGPSSISLGVSLAASLPAQLASTTTHATATSSSGQGLVCLDIYLKAAAEEWQI